MGEIGIVTAGILIAFALDAWWDNRATAEREQIHLRALASDLEQNIATLQDLVGNEEKIMASSKELLRLAEPGQQGSAASLDQHFSMVFNSRRYEPVMGAYEALVNSGGLTLIRDATLRAALAGFAAKVRGRYEETWSDEHYFAFAREFGGRLVLLHAREPAPEAREREYREMLQDERFLQHVAMRYFSERDITTKYRDLLAQAEAVRASVDGQIRESD